MDYLELLNNSYNMELDTSECPPKNRLDYLGEYIFNFTTYDGEFSELFARKAVEVCAAINNRLTFEFINDASDYKWYLLMCNMPFFADRIEWGSSIRGAWWSWNPGKHIELQSCGLWVGFEQLSQTMQFTNEDWGRFVAALVEFANSEEE